MEGGKEMYERDVRETQKVIFSILVIILNITYILNGLQILI